MKLSFFGCAPNPELSEHLIIYILSLLDPATQYKAALVNKEWNKYVNLARQYMALLPTIHRVPSLNTVGLDVLKLKLLAGGMTNKTFKLKVRTAYPANMDGSEKKESAYEKFVLRIPGKGSSAFITRSEEAHNALQAERLGLNVPIVFFDPDDGLQLTRFIDGVRSLDKNELARKEILHCIAQMMKQLHSSAPFNNSTHFFERNEELLQILKVKQFNFPGDIALIEEGMSQLEKLFSAYKIEMKPCHNDTTPLNFIMSYKGKGPDRTELIHEIDWEYSSNNDFLWDLVYFVIEAKLSDEQIFALLSAYVGSDQVPVSMLAWVELYKPIIEWWITVWSWTQVANQANAVDLQEYSSLGYTRYLKTITHLTSIEFEDAFKLVEEEKSTPSFSGSRPF